MKITKFIPLAATILLASCGGSASQSSSEATEESSSDSSTSSEEPSSTTSSEDEAAVIKNFLSILYPLNGHPNKATVSQENTYDFGIAVSGEDDFTVERFSRERASDIAVRKGVSTVGSNVTNYETQTFSDGFLIYALTKYEDVPASKSSATYEDSMLELNIGFSFYYSQESNLNYLARYLYNESVDCEIDLPESIPSSGTTSFSYSMAISDEKVSHDYSITTDNGIITAYTHNYVDESYVGSQVINSTITKETVSFEQGEYASFTGEVWNPSDFDNE